MDPRTTLSSSFSHPNSQSPNLTAASQTQSQTTSTATADSAQVSHNAQSTSTNHPTLEAYPHQINGAGGPTATAPFLRDFSLVAEAAKRAQMAVMMRDLESVTL